MKEDEYFKYSSVNFYLKKQALWKARLHRQIKLLNSKLQHAY